MARHEDKLVPGAVWESATVTVDARQHPLVVVTFRGVVADDDFERHLRVLSSSLALRKRGTVVMDTTHGAARSAKSLRLLRQWLDSERDAMAEIVAGLALVVPSAAVRFIISTFMLTTELPYPHVVVDSLDAGLSYARKQLAEAEK